MECDRARRGWTGVASKFAERDPAVAAVGVRRSASELPFRLTLAAEVDAALRIEAKSVDPS